MAITIGNDELAQKVFSQETVVSKFMNGREVYLHGISLRPETPSLVFVDDKDVTTLCQPANQIKITDPMQAYNFEQGDGILNKTTYAFAKSIATSNNIIYVDENYLSIKVEKYDDKTAIPQYEPGDIIYQASYSPTTYTLVAPNPDPNPEPLYRVSNVASEWGWGSWMLAHAVWGSNSLLGSHAYVFPNVFLAAGTYNVTYAIDDVGVVKVGTKTIINETTYGNNAWQNGKNKTTTFTIDVDGDYPISWSCTNYGGPGGISLVIVKDNKVYFDTATAYSTQLTKQYHVEQTFQARVEYVQYFDNKTKAILTIKPEFGSININPAAANDVAVIRRFSISKDKLKPSYSYDNLISITSDTDICKLQSTPFLSGDLWPVGSVIQRIPGEHAARKTIVTTESATIKAYEHYSGLCLPTSSGTNFYTVSKYDRTIDRMVDQLTVYNSSSGTSLQRNIASTPGINQLTLASGFTGMTSNTKYAVGRNMVDEYGSLSCILNIPESLENSFIAGSKKITVMDADSGTPASSEFLMKASAYYSAARPIRDEYSVTPSVPVQQFAPRVEPPPRHDPVAQTFFVPSSIDTNTGSTTAPYGIYVSSVDIWFSRKPYSSSEPLQQLPVMLRIVDVQTGLPTTKIIAETHVEYKDIQVPVGNIFDRSLYTKFTFDDPVFLPEGGEYAIVIQSDSPNYNVMISQMGKYTLPESATSTKPPSFVGSQPYVGSFFKSQNASTWEPIWDTDLVFRINKCEFSKDVAGTVQFNTKSRAHEVFADAIVVYSSETNHKPTKTSYSIKTKNILNESDLSETFIQPNNLYDFGGDLKTSLKSSTRRRWIVGGEKYSFNVAAHLSSTDVNVSPVISRDSLKVLTYTCIINDAGISNNCITVTDGGLHKNLSNIMVTVSSPDDSAGSSANAFVYSLGAPNALGYSAIKDLVLDAEGSGYYTSPQIRVTEHYDVGTIASNTTTTLTDSTKTWTTDQWKNYYVEIITDTISAGSFVPEQTYIIDTVGTTNFTALGAQTNCRGIKFTATDAGLATTTGKAKLYTYKKIITNSASVLTVEGWDSGMPTILTNNSLTNTYKYRIIGPVQAQVAVAGETDSTGGNCETRYISKVVDLAEGFNAGDLKVYLDCIRPRGTNILVYYKAKSGVDGDSFSSKKWQLMSKLDDKYSPDQKTIIQLEFLPLLNEEKQLIYFENGKSYPIGGTFNKFSIKIVMTAADPTVTPIVVNYSAIAVPAG